MTVKELKEYVKNLPEDCEVLIEYDGPDTYTMLSADGFIIADDNSYILLTKGEN